jgi:hypothetical protein
VIRKQGDGSHASFYIDRSIRTVTVLLNRLHKILKIMPKTDKAREVYKNYLKEKEENGQR